MVIFVVDLEKCVSCAARPSDSLFHTEKETFKIHGE